VITFTVYGVPVPQGSKVPVKNKAGRIVGSRESNDARLRPWRQEVANGAEIAAREVGCLDGPLSLNVTFRFPMPKSASKVDRVRGWRPKSTTPDADKLLRAVGDALKAGGLVADDARFAFIRLQKIEVLDAWTGAEISVGPFEMPRMEVVA
jgi:crossover junction endodeoxyribonuclease RusA